jgi:hypothetical protein
LGLIVTYTLSIAENTDFLNDPSSTMAAFKAEVIEASQDPFDQSILTTISTLTGHVNQLQELCIRATTKLGDSIQEHAAVLANLTGSTKGDRIPLAPYVPASILQVHSNISAL